MSQRHGSIRLTIAALVTIIAAMGYKFIVAGSTERADDGRLAIVLDPAERALMLREMREFVVGLQAIADGLARGDMKTVAHVGEQTIAHRTGTRGRTSDRTHARPLGGAVTSAVCALGFLAASRGGCSSGR